MSLLEHQDRVINIISKDSSQRTDRDIDMVLPWLRKKSDVLKGLDLDILKDVIRHCSYQRSIADDILIRQGDKGDCFYIMLSGRTSVYIDTLRADDGILQAQPQENTHVDSDLGEFTILGRKKKPLDRSKFGKFIMHFDAGKSFGEIALISDDAVRNATIIADEGTDLLVISRNLFNRSIKDKQEEEYRERKRFVDTCPVFCTWSTKLKRLCEMSIRKESHPYGSVIATQGQPTVGLVFIYRGQAKLVIEPSKHVSQYPKLMQNRQTVYDLNKHINPDGSVHKEGVTSSHIRLRRKEGYVAAEKRLMSRFTNLCSVEEGEVVGDTEMVLDLDSNLGSLESTGETVVFVLNTKNYERLVQRKNPHTADALKVEVYQKLTARMSTPIGAQVHLLKKLHKLLEESFPTDANDDRRSEHTRRKGLINLIDMFLENKGPFIQPYIQDSLYYKKRSSEKAKRILANAKFRNNLRNNGGRTPRLPRSLEKLKNNPEAERELLGFEFFQTRPITSGILQGQSSGNLQGRSSPIARVQSANDSVTVTRCEIDSSFASSGEHGEGPDREFVAEIYEEMEMYQREKLDERTRMMTSGVRKVKDGEEDGEDYYDWETSDSNLCDLESRIKDFCQHNCHVRTPRDKFYVSEMRRFEIEHPDYVPIPGGSVFVHKKPCRFPPDAPISPVVHQHVRRFMLSRHKQHYAGTNAVSYS